MQEGGKAVATAIYYKAFPLYVWLLVLIIFY